MENNDYESNEEELDETATDAEQIEENEEDGDDTVETLKAQVAKYKAIAERKEKKLKEKPKETNKPNTEQPLSREETIFFAQGGTEETYNIAKKIADTQGISILAAKEDDYFKFQVNKINEEAKVKSNMIGSGSGGNTKAGHAEKPLSEMTREEHEAYVKKKING